MNYYPVTDRQTDRKTDGDVYKPTVQFAQVGSIKFTYEKKCLVVIKKRKKNNEVRRIFNKE